MSDIRDHRYVVLAVTRAGEVKHVELYSSLRTAENAARRLRRGYRRWLQPPDVKVSVRNAGVVRV